MRADDTIFGLYSLGLGNGAKTHTFTTSRVMSALEIARQMTEDYLAAISDDGGKP